MNLEKSTILFTGKCNREFRASLSKGESLREDRNKGIWGQLLSQIRVISIKVRPLEILHQKATTNYYATWPIEV